MTSNNIVFPKEYNWLVDRYLVGYSEFSQLQPWYYLPKDKCFWANEKWPTVSSETLFVFAKRQDNDDLACFKVLAEGKVEGVYLIHGWTSKGFEIIQYFPDFWSWLHTVLQDMKEWIEIVDYAS